MSEENDPRLLALFAESRAALPGADFMESFLARLARARRIRTLRRLALIAAAAVLAACFLPSVLQHTAAAVYAMGRHSPSHAGALIISPAGWAVSTLIALGVLVRTGALRLGRRR